MVQNLRTVSFQRASTLSVGELKEEFIEEAGPGESPRKWITFGWKKEGISGGIEDRLNCKW